jgi:hypothetical protein
MSIYLKIPSEKFDIILQLKLVIILTAILIDAVTL